MKRLLFRFFCIISLLLVIASAGLWVRSYRTCDQLRWSIHKPTESEDDWQNLYREYRVYTLISFQGGTYFHAKNREVWMSTPYPPDFEHTTFTRGYPPESETSLGVTAFTLHWERGASWNARWLIVPYWGLVVIFSLTPLITAIGWLRPRFKSRDPNLCARCGYDLRESPQRCPECGTMRPASRL